MEFTIQREALLKPLQLVVGAAERKSTRAILSNVLLQLTTHQLILTATDTELELKARVTLIDPATPGATTVPARKLIDICRTLPAEQQLHFRLDKQQLHLTTGRSHFSLSTLPADEFPDLEHSAAEYECTVQQTDLRYLIESTHFSMGSNDVRYYLNGIFLQIHHKRIDAVATDGHRLAFCQIEDPALHGEHQVILPRKAVLELLRLIEDNEEAVGLHFSTHHFCLKTSHYSFASKLINSRFPDYTRVIPVKSEQTLVVDKDLLRDALSRVSILCNEKYKGVRIQLRAHLIRIIATNPEQEEAIEELVVAYEQEDLDVGFNVSYIIDVLSNLPSGDVRLEFCGAKSSMVLRSLVDEQRLYVVMPMRV